jgi:uncharacterized protein YsxB (DUF464 family)
LILISIRRNIKNGRISAFTAENHGRSEVCAAVSLMVLNTVNSVEALTGEPFKCEYDENGGFIDFSMDKAPGKNAGLLLESMWLGLRSVRDKYDNEINLSEEQDV